MTNAVPQDGEFSEREQAMFDDLGDKMAASIFLIASGWVPKTQIVYPDIIEWVGFNLIMADGEFPKYVKSFL